MTASDQLSEFPRRRYQRTANRLFGGCLPWAIAVCASMTIQMFQPPCIVADPQDPISDDIFDYRAKGPNILVFDWATCCNLSVLQQRVVNRRATALVESRAKEDIQSVSTDVTAFNDNNISLFNFYWPSVQRTVSERDESAFLHSTNHPASLVAFADEAGVELHWLADRRQDYALHSGNTKVATYRIYRSRNGGPLSGMLAEVPLQNWSAQFQESLSEPGEYMYVIRSLVDNGGVIHEASLDSATVTFPGPSTPTNQYWLEQLHAFDVVYIPAPTYTITTSITVQLASRSPSSEAIYCNVKSPDKAISVAAVPHLMSVESTGDGQWRYTLSLTETVTASYSGYAISFGIGKPPNQTPLFSGAKFTTNPNNRLRYRYYNNYIVNRGHPAWVSAWTQGSDDLLRLGTLRPYDGIYADSGDPTLPSTNVAPVDIYSGHTYWQSLTDALSQVHVWAHGKVPAPMVMLNGLQNTPYRDSTEWSNYVDGVSIESFVYDNSYRSFILGDWWIWQMQAMVLAKAHNHLSIVNGLCSVPEDSAETRLFCLGSYLLVEGPETTFSARFLNGTSQVMSYLPEFQIDMGQRGQVPSFGEPIEFAEGTERQNPRELPPGKSVERGGLFVRSFANGVVVVNNTNFYDEVNWSDRPGTSLDYSVSGTLYRLHCDNRNLLSGGRIWTEEVAGTISLLGGEAAILLNQPIRSPDIDPVALYPIYSTPGVGSVFAVHASHWNGERMWLEIDASTLGVSAPVTLRDDGAGNDTCADDGIYTSDTIAITGASPGNVDLQCYARGDDGIAAYQSVGFQVIGVPQAKYINATASGTDNRGLTYSGVPYSCTTIDYDVDGKDDLLVSLRNDYGQLFKRINAAGESLPLYQPRTNEAFGGELTTGLRGMAVAALANSDYPSVFMAHRTSPRLYAHNGVVYPSSGSGFIEVGQYFGLPSVAEDSWCGAWGDYDADGYADLFVGRARTKAAGGSNPCYDIEEGLGGVLLRSRAKEGGLFENTSSILGEAADRLAAATTASWGDINSDGRMDLFVGQLSAGADTLPDLPEFHLMGGGATESPQSRLFVQQVDGTFTEELQQRLVEGSTGWVMSSKWADIDSDGDEDLVLAGAQGVSWLRNDGDSLACKDLPYWTSSRGAAAMDFDLDGRRDILALPDSLGANVIGLYWNNEAPSGAPYFADVAPWMGIAEYGDDGADGISVTDFNQDGDPDFYLGKPVSSNAFLFQNKRADGALDSPVNHWVGIRLEGGGAGDNLAAIGAVVTVQDQKQRVDGGSGRGGQDPRTLTFGLGQYSGSTVAAEIAWPNGSTQASTLTVGQVNSVLDAGRDPQIQDSSISGSSEPFPGMETIWVFRWATLYPTIESEDWVHLQSTYDANPAPSPCDIGQEFTEIRQGDPWVTVQPVEIGANGWYWHELRWRRACVSGCTYWFRVYSSSMVQEKSGPSSGSWKRLLVPVCISEDPDPNQP